MMNFLRSLGIAVLLLVPTAAFATTTGSVGACCPDCPCPCCK
jgi:hypothetical protein